MKLNFKFLGALALSALSFPTFADVDQVGIRIVEASYGANVNLGLRGNATTSITGSCSGLTSCRYKVDTRYLGDPAFGYSKDFTVTYRCGSELKREYVPAEANGRSVYLECNEDYRPRPNPNPNLIRVRNATYGGNVYSWLNGNATNDLASYCDGKTICDYTVSTRYLGDPARGYPKDFAVEYSCGRELFRQYIGAEANNSRLVLRCY